VAGLSLALGQAGVGILALTPELATLEDLFFRLTDGKDADGTPQPPGARGPAGAPDEQRLVQAQ
jgi:hypothetical protein